MLTDTLISPVSVTLVPGAMYITVLGAAVAVVVKLRIDPATGDTVAQ